MPAIDTRHAERARLYALLVADYTGDVKAEINRTIAAMEADDVKAVKEQFEQWKAKEGKG